VDDSDVEVLDEDQDAGAGVGSADADVVESAGVAEGEFSVLVDAVGADAVVGVEALAWGGFGSGVVGGGAVVAPNTIYWYFGDKDDVLIAVLDSVMADIWPQYRQVATEPIPARLLWVVRQLHQMSRLVTTVHARVEHSAAIAEWHRNFHLITGSMFRYELETAGVSSSTVEAEVMIGIFTVEGLLMHDLNEIEELTICDTLASRWTLKEPRQA